MKKILYRLQSYYNHQATEVERPVIRYILDNPREVASMDIHALAKIGYCSAPTVVRICKKNGFKGFREVKIAILNDLNFSDQIYKENFLDIDQEGIKPIVQKVLKQNLNTISNTYNLIDYGELSKIIELLDEARIVRLFGIGASFLVAKDFQQKLERINKTCILYEDTHLQLVSASNTSVNDLAIVISYSGLTKEIIEMAEIIKAHGGVLVAITKYSNNRLMNLADYSLFVPNIEGPNRLSAGSSRISQLCIIDIIYNSYIENVKDKFIDKLVDTGKLFEKGENIE